MERKTFSAGVFHSLTIVLCYDLTMRNAPTQIKVQMRPYGEVNHTEFI